MDKVMYRVDLFICGAHILDLYFDSLEELYEYIAESFDNYCGLFPEFPEFNINVPVIKILFTGDLTCKEGAVELWNAAALKIDKTYHKVTKFYVQS